MKLPLDREVQAPIHATQMMLLGQLVCIDYSEDLQKHKTDEEFLMNVLCMPSRLVETPLWQP